MIRAQDLSFGYPDGTRALHDINLEVRHGEVLALMGANGCGKTTLLKHLIGLLKPATGKLYLDGREYRHFRPEEVFSQIGIVFQDPNDQLFAATVEQDVAFGAANLGLAPEEVTRRTREALMMVDALELAGRPIHALSFGQKRRVTIAGVLAMRPRLLLLDEPTSGLDPRGVSAIMRLLRRLNRDRGITMIMATHDVELVPLFCDRVAVMRQGTITAIGTPEGIFADVAMLRDTEMRLPRIAHLVEILHKRDGLDSSTMPLTIGAARRAGRLLADRDRPPLDKLRQRSIK